MEVLTFFQLFFLGALIFCGGIFTSTYEKAPIGERIQVLGVGIGIYTGILLLYC
jgi:hypothetical protein